MQARLSEPADILQVDVEIKYEDLDDLEDVVEDEDAVRLSKTCVDFLLLDADHATRRRHCLISRTHREGHRKHLRH